MWFKTFLIIWFAFDGLGMVSLIGVERVKITRWAAVLSVIINAALIIGLLRYWK